MTKTILAVLCVSTVFAYVASATIHTFTISLDSSQVVPPNASPGSGSGTATFDDATGTLSWQFSVSGLSGAVIDADFHAPAAPGATAPKVNDAFAGYVGSAGTGTGSGSTIIYTPAAELLNNLWYLTIATNTYPTSSGQDGEIRGQLIRVVAPPAVDHSDAIRERKIRQLKKKIRRIKKKLRTGRFIGSQFNGPQARKLKKKLKKMEAELNELDDE